MNKVLFINSADEKCGVYQYGLTTYKIISKSQNIAFNYYNASSAKELSDLSQEFEIAVFNFHEKTMPWLSDEVLNLFEKAFVIVGHDCFPTFKKASGFIHCDSTFPKADNIFPVGRPILNTGVEYSPASQGITVGAFGFSFFSKNFHSFPQLVSSSFANAKIRMHIPQHPHGDSQKTIKEYIASVNSFGLEIEITDKFLSTEELISFLNSNSINVFLYPEMPGRGLSSVIDYALASKQPLAISDCDMFRHINSERRIKLSNYSLPEILSFGKSPTNQFRELWSEENLIKQYEDICLG